MFHAIDQVGLPILGVVENMSGLRQRLGDFKFMRADGPGGSERDATAEILDQLRRTAPDLLVRSSYDEISTRVHAI